MRPKRSKLSLRERRLRSDAFKAAVANGGRPTVPDSAAGAAPTRCSVAGNGISPDLRSLLLRVLPGRSTSVLWADGYAFRFETDSPGYAAHLGFPVAGLGRATDIVGIVLDRTHKKDISKIASGIRALIGGNMNRSPKEEAERCRRALAEAESVGADPRTVGLWRSKLARAENSELVGAEEEVRAEQAAAAAVAEDTPETVGAPGAVSPGLGLFQHVPAQAAPRPAAVSRPQSAATPGSAPVTAPGGVLGPAGLGPCLCGCGREVAKGRSFRPGHDARFASYIKRLDAGKLTPSDLPELVRRLVAEDHDVVVRARSHK